MAYRRQFGMADDDDVWPALSDTMLALLLIMVLFFSFQIARNVTIQSEDDAIKLNQIFSDQRNVQRIVRRVSEQYGQVQIQTTDVFEQEITLGADALFSSGKADLSVEGERILSVLVGEIAQADIKTIKEITVKGHTDNYRINNATFPSNWELSTSRATRIVRKLTGEDGGEMVIDPREVTLVASGYGPHDPLDVNDLAANRRIEIRLVYTNPEVDDDTSK